MMGVSKSFYSLLKRDEVWRGILKSELHVDSLDCLPPGSLATPICSAVELYILWRDEFKGYTGCEIGEVRDFWLRMEAWMGKKFPALLRTLGPPASEEAISQAEVLVDKIFPRPLRLLYRFHDGQNISFNEVRLGFNTSHAMDEDMDLETLRRGSFEGIFGGVFYYNKVLNMWLIPLRMIPKLSSICFGMFMCIFMRMCLISNPTLTLPLPPPPPPPSPYPLPLHPPPLPGRLPERFIPIVTGRVR